MSVTATPQVRARASMKGTMMQGGGHGLDHPVCSERAARLVALVGPSTEATASPE